ncbi:MAG: SDR family NAD(P)-dependent oxidoreductase, partial [Myxococcota bacterium]
MSRFSQRSAIVTGAAAGIGRATAQLLAAEGAAVAVFDIAEEGAQETAQAIEASGGRAFVRVCDISDPGSVQESVDAAREALGPLSVLCNVAGLQQWTRIEDTSYELWSRILGINLTGTYL